MNKKLEYIKKSAKVVSLILKTLKEKIENWTVKNGKELEKIAKNIMEQNEVFSSTYEYHGFPGYICVSVSNEKESVLTHGIPNEILFSEGDLVSVDVACFCKDEEEKQYHADAALTAIIRDTKDQKKKKLLKVTKNCLDFVVSQIVPPFPVSKIGEIIQKYVESRGFFIIKEYGGHAIGNALHEDPFIPNFRKSEDETLIVPGMFICIEPLVQINDTKIEKREIEVKDKKKWKEIISTNGFPNAHFEHTIYVDEKEALILTDYES